MAENEYNYLEQALPGFSQARLIVKAGGDIIRPISKAVEVELTPLEPQGPFITLTMSHKNVGRKTFIKLVFMI